ncbi:hypothetical protein [Bosea sp. TAF32]|uniref:hypothetical protein n=1 Tax=Bosea sp. TAF32 TaxID=3237482 RepID=UPI003F91F652
MNVVPWDTLQTGFGNDNVGRPKGGANIFGTSQGRFQTMSLPEHLGQNRRDMPQGDILQASPVLGDMEREAQHRSGDGNETSPSQDDSTREGRRATMSEPCSRVWTIWKFGTTKPTRRVRPRPANSASGAMDRENACTPPESR